MNHPLRTWVRSWWRRALVVAGSSLVAAPVAQASPCGVSQAFLGVGLGGMAVSAVSGTVTAIAVTGDVNGLPSLGVMLAGPPVGLVSAVGSLAGAADCKDPAAMRWASLGVLAGSVGVPVAFGGLSMITGAAAGDGEFRNGWYLIGGVFALGGAGVTAGGLALTVPGLDASVAVAPMLGDRRGVLVAARW